MALDEYRKKRNFKASPEPAGDETLRARRARREPEKTPRFFCVQKHLASQLHYDFRLEHNGVLLSWAVPKGPSIDARDKRLAMHVEDHPLEYGEFEGVIPSGYGAGIVQLWDQGTWDPEVDDVDAALKKGDLKFRLNGYKLKGSWVLVRTGGYGASRSGRADGRSWLLIKHRDEWEGQVDITTFAPLSVKSSGDFADILAADNPDVWVSNREGGRGVASAMFNEIIAQARKIRAQANDAGRGRRKTAAPARPKDAGPAGKVPTARAMPAKKPRRKAAG